MHAQIYTPSGIIQGSSGSTTNVGIGIAIPTSALHISKTLPTTGGFGLEVSITGSGNTDLGLGNRVIAGHSILNAGYTGSSGTASLYFTNMSAGTGTNPYSGTGRANYGVQGDSRGTTSGTNVGGDFLSICGKKNYGLMGHASYNLNSPTHNIGIIGYAAGATCNVGGYFALFPDNNNGIEPNFESAALVANNGTYSNPIF